MLGSYELFGSSPFALKLPNVIFFPVYFFFVWKISGRIQSRWIRWGFLISMLFAHNFFEFFGTGRGYGMSVGLVMAAVWFAMQALNTGKTKDYIFTFLFLILANYANLTLMNAFVLIAGLLMLSLFISQQQFKLKKAIVIFVLGIIPIVLLIILLFRIKAEGELYYGKPDGFLEVSVLTLGKLLTGNENHTFVYAAVGLYFISLAIFIQRSFKNKNGKWLQDLINPNWLFFYLITGSFIASILENKLFGINYPEDRTGLYLYPWLTGAVFFGLDQLKVKRWWLKIIPAIPFLFFPLHFLTHINLSWSSMENQAIPQRFHDVVANDQEAGDYPLIVQGYQGRVMRWAFMNFRQERQLSRIFFDDFPSMNGDYQIADINKNPDWLTKYDSIDGDRRTGFSLLKRQEKLTRSKIFTKSSIQTPEIISDEFYELYRGPVDTLRGNALLAGFTLNLVSQKNPFHGRVVSTIFDDQNNSLHYEFVPFDWYRTDWSNAEKNFTNALYIPELPANAKSMVIYVWNIHRKPFQISNGQLDILKLYKD